MKRSPLKSKPRRRGKTEAQQSAAWWDAVMAKTRGRCWVNPDVFAADAHHLIPKQSLRRRGLDQAVWDPRNGIPLSRRVHERHTSRVEPLSRSCLPPEVFEFAAEYGLEPLLDRYYPVAA